MNTKASVAYGWAALTVAGVGAWIYQRYHHSKYKEELINEKLQEQQGQSAPHRQPTASDPFIYKNYPAQQQQERKESTTKTSK